MRLEYYPKDGKYLHGKRIWWYWEFYRLPYYRKIRWTTPIGGFNLYY